MLITVRVNVMAQNNGYNDNVCINCVEKIPISVWVPKDVHSFMEVLNNKQEACYQTILLEGVKANLESMEAGHPAISVLIKQITDLSEGHF